MARAACPEFSFFGGINFTATSHRLMFFLAKVGGKHMTTFRLRNLVIVTLSAALFGCGDGSGSNSGRNTCDPGQASCGKSDAVITCGSYALTQKKHDVCSAMDAQAVGQNGAHCLCMLGYAWDGKACTAIGDCACQGADCDKLTTTKEECESQHAACAVPQPITCGSFALTQNTHNVCSAMDAQAVGQNGAHCLCMLGYAWDGKACTALGDCACQGADCDKLTKTQQECESQHAICGS
jgi:hypothetical protein